MIATVDTSPLSYMISLGYAELLPELFERVLIPPAVLAELSHPKAPQKVREWIAATPPWLHVCAPKKVELTLGILGPGESEAIALASEQSAGILVIDERAGREEARQRGIPLIGTLSILLDAGLRGRLDFTAALEALQRCGFRVSRQLREAMLTRYAREQGLWPDRD